MELNHKDVKVYLKILYDNVLDEVSHYKYYLSNFSPTTFGSFNYAIIEEFFYFEI